MDKQNETTSETQQMESNANDLNAGQDTPIGGEGATQYRTLSDTVSPRLTNAATPGAGTGGFDETESENTPGAGGTDAGLAGGDVGGAGPYLRTTELEGGAIGGRNAGGDIGGGGDVTGGDFDDTSETRQLSGVEAREHGSGDARERGSAEASRNANSAGPELTKDNPGWGSGETLGISDDQRIPEPETGRVYNSAGGQNFPMGPVDNLDQTHQADEDEEEDLETSGSSQKNDRGPSH